MSCFHPRHVTITKLEPVTRLFNVGDKVGDEVLVHHYAVREFRKVKHTILVPCGKCLACLSEQQKQWSFRIENEVLYGGHVSCLFVTLTYAPDYLPDDKSLHKEEVQKYLHNLRQLIDRKYEENFRPRCVYYFCGEYGSKFGRPHFHALLMFSKSIDYALIQRAWRKGIVDIRPVLPAHCGYVAKYSQKQIGDGDYGGRVLPFRLCSKGLGSCFLKGKTLASIGYVSYWRNSSGVRIKLPRYYMDKLSKVRTYVRYKNTTDTGFVYYTSRSSTRPLDGYTVYKRKSELAAIANERMVMLANNWDYARFSINIYETLKNREQAFIAYKNKLTYGKRNY